MVSSHRHSAFSLFPLSNGSQQVDKQIDKIQIQLQGREDGCLGRHLSVMAVCLVIGSDLLSVVSGEEQEDEDPERIIAGKLSGGK